MRMTALGPFEMPLKRKADMVAALPAAHGSRVEIQVDYLLEEILLSVEVATTRGTTDPLEALKALGKAEALFDLIVKRGVDLSKAELTAIETIRMTLSTSVEIIARRIAQGVVALNAADKSPPCE